MFIVPWQNLSTDAACTVDATEVIAVKTKTLTLALGVAIITMKE